jgi:hypothetical protein
VSIESSRGAERPAGGPGSATKEGVTMQILSTEHWSLLATRSLGYTDIYSRANMFFTVLSGAVIALALIAQAGHFGETFTIAAVLLLGIVVFVGLTTIARIGQLNYEDSLWVTGMNRIRHAYLELHPELKDYFITSQHDDMSGIMKTLGIRTTGEPGQHLFADLSHVVTIVPGMMMIIVAVVAGAWGAIASVALGASQPVAILVGAVFFVLTVTTNMISGRRNIRGWSKGLQSKFPTPPEVK